MPSIDPRAGIVTLKIVYYGCALSGKTTNLRYLYNALPLGRRGDFVSVATQTERTLHFDVLPVTVGEGARFQARFQLYTVPGQAFYNATRQLVLRGVDGIVFVADSQWDRMADNVESYHNLAANLAERSVDVREVPVVFQYNKRDLPDVAPASYLEFLLNRGPRRRPSFVSEAVSGPGVFATLNAVCGQVLASPGLTDIVGPRQAADYLPPAAAGV